MKNLLILSLLLVANLTFAEAVKENREIGEFNAIDVSKGANITLVQCDKFGLEVVVEGCPLTDVVTEVKGQTLYVKMAKKTPGSAVQVTVYFKDINSLNIKQGASADTGCHFEHKGEFTLGVGAKGEVDMDIDVETIKVNANSCRISLAGDAKKQIVDVVGALQETSYDATQLVTEDVDITVSNTQALVRFSNSMTADVKAGTLKYLGDDEKAKITTSLGGTAEKLK